MRYFVNPYSVLHDQSTGQNGLCQGELGKESVVKLHICYGNTLLSITFEPVVQFLCFKAIDVYFSKKPSFYYLVGPFSLESAGKQPNYLKSVA